MGFKIRLFSPQINKAKYAFQITRKSNQNADQVKKPDHPFTSTDCLRAQSWCGTSKTGDVGGPRSAPIQPAVSGDKSPSAFFCFYSPGKELSEWVRWLFRELPAVFFWPCHAAFWDLIPLIRDGTHDPCSGSGES